jgi:hypothetical protein
MQTFNRKAGDTAPLIQSRLYLDGSPFNLTTATVRLVAVRASSGVASSIVASVVSVASATVSANISTLLATADMFNLEWEVTDGTAIVTFPGEGYDRLIVEPDLD